MQELFPQNLLIGKRVIFSMSKTEVEEGIILNSELIMEGLNKPVVSGYAILLNDNSLAHIAYWRVKGVITGGHNIEPTFVKERAEYNEPVDTFSSTSPDAVDDLPF